MNTPFASTARGMLSSPRLPPEIFTEIINFLALPMQNGSDEDVRRARKALASCALTSRAWFNFCSNYLYAPATLHIRTLRQIREQANYLKRCACDKTTSLVIEDGHDLGPISPLVPTHLANGLPNVQTLAFKNSSMGSCTLQLEDSALTHLLGFGNVTELLLEGYHFPSMTELQQISCHLPSLTSLRLSEVSWESDSGTMSQGSSPVREDAEFRGRDSRLIRLEMRRCHGPPAQALKLLFMNDDSEPIRGFQRIERSCRPTLALNDSRALGLMIGLIPWPSDATNIFSWDYDASINAWNICCSAIREGRKPQPDLLVKLSSTSAEHYSPLSNTVGITSVSLAPWAEPNWKEFGEILRCLYSLSHLRISLSYTRDNPKPSDEQSRVIVQQIVQGNVGMTVPWIEVQVGDDVRWDEVIYEHGNLFQSNVSDLSFGDLDEDDFSMGTMNGSSSDNDSDASSHKEHFTLDPQHIVDQLILPALRWHGYKELLFDKRGKEAQQILDAMQQLLDGPNHLCRDSISKAIVSQARPLLIRLLVRLSRESHMLPSAVFLSGVQRDSPDPVCGGGFADIFKGSHRGEAVGLKRLRVFQMSTNSELERSKRKFCVEAVMWRQLRHPNILPFLGVDAETFGNCYCMVSPWLKYGCAMDCLKYHEEEVQWDEETRLRQLMNWVLDIISGLCYLHSERVIHGDLRGQNILIDDHMRAKLTDFGLSKHADMNTISWGTCSSNSVRWQPVEVHLGGRASTESDMYSFGCVCLQLYTGSHPFPNLQTDPMVLAAIMVKGARPLIPSHIEKMHRPLFDLVRLCWQDEPEVRPSAKDIKGHLTANGTTFGSSPIST